MHFLRHASPRASAPCASRGLCGPRRSTPALGWPFFSSQQPATRYNHTRRFDWRPLRTEVFGPVTAVPPLPPPATRATLLPAAEPDEHVQRPPTRLPLAAAAQIETNEEGQVKRKAFTFAAPLARERLVDVEGWAHGVGGRKTAVARVSVRPAQGAVTVRVNGRDLDQYFPSYLARELVLEPLLVTETIGYARGVPGFPLFFVDCVPKGCARDQSQRARRWAAGAGGRGEARACACAAEPGPGVAMGSQVGGLPDA